MNRPKEILKFTAILIGSIFIMIVFLMLSVYATFALLTGKSHFINDTDESVEFMLFSYDNYGRDYGSIRGPLEIKSNQTKSIREDYPVCLHVIETGQSYFVPTKPSQEPSFNISALSTAHPCPLDIKTWSPKTKWSCPSSKAGYETCELRPLTQFRIRFP